MVIAHARNGDFVLIDPFDPDLHGLEHGLSSCDCSPRADRHLGRCINCSTMARARPTCSTCGGDWNRSLAGKEVVGSMDGRRALTSLLSRLTLDVPTTHLPHRNDVLRTIDHISSRAPKATATRMVAATDGRRCSDHDAYRAVL